MWYAWSENATRSYGDQRSNPSRRHSAFTRQRPPVGGFGNIVSGVFTPVLAKHSKSFSLIDCISVGVDRMQRNFEPMRKQVEAWQSLHSHTLFRAPQNTPGAPVTKVILI